MEVTSSRRQVKRLHRHAAPVFMVAAALLALPAIILNGYNGTGPNSASILSKGLVTQVLHVRPTPNGLAKITFGPAPSGPNANPALQAGLAQAGATVQLSLSLQALPDNQ